MSNQPETASVVTTTTPVGPAVIASVAPAGPKVAICIPTMITVDARWALNLPKVLGTAPPNSTFFAEWRYGVAETRESLYHTAMKSIPDLTHVFYYDADIIPITDFPIQTLLQDNKQIVSGVYWNSLYTGVAAWKDEKPINMAESRNSPLIECDKVGMGCCLISIEVFKTLIEADEPRPFFQYIINTKTNTLMSEDFAMLAKCAKFGIKPWLDSRVQCMHLKNLGILPNGQVQVDQPPPPPPAAPAPAPAQPKT